MKLDLTGATPPESLREGFATIRRTATFEFRKDAGRLIAIMESWPTAPLADRETVMTATQPYIYPASA